MSCAPFGRVMADVSQKEFEMIHYICPECEDEGDLPDDTQIEFCGICAGDVGRDVALRKTFNVANNGDDRATQPDGDTVENQTLGYMRAIKKSSCRR